LALPRFAGRLPSRGGCPDGNGHPNVGLSVFLWHNIPLWRCSGTMVAAKVYLTAGTAPASTPDLGFAPDRAEVWFSSGPIRSGRTRSTATRARRRTPATRARVTSPARRSASGLERRLDAAEQHDMGVVQLTQAPNVGISKIAPQGYLDGLATQRGHPERQLHDRRLRRAVRAPEPRGRDQTRFVGTNQLQNLRSHLAGGYN
jgi:hypothetical protein